MGRSNRLGHVERPILMKKILVLKMLDLNRSDAFIRLLCLFIYYSYTYGVICRRFSHRFIRDSADKWPTHSLVSTMIDCRVWRRRQMIL